ncbi:hypothetical protein C8J57DRAFT_1630231 [Mycena rebaudengoi]|nr:hypothetical protein C8J57DRAFT_1630231 [Mycena rebaudengoi]
MEKELLDPTGATEFLVLDLMAAHRTETNAARCIARCACELVLNMRTLVICGLVRDGGLHADFVRAEVPLAFDAEEKVGEKDTLVFTTQRECMAWCQWQRHWSMSLDSKLPDMYHQAMGGAFRTFCRLVDFDVSLPRTAVLGYEPYLDTIFVLDGEICFVNLMANREAPAPRLSLRDLLRYIPQETVRVVHARLIEIYRPRTRKSEDVVDLRSQARVGVVLKQSVVVHIEGDKLGSWAERKFRGLTNVVRI